MHYLQMLTSVKREDKQLEEEIYELFSARFADMDPDVLREVIRSEIELYKQKQIAIDVNKEMEL